jgi:hypothetical protein
LPGATGSEHRAIDIEEQDEFGHGERSRSAWKAPSAGLPGLWRIWLTSLKCGSRLRAV